MKGNENRANSAHKLAHGCRALAVLQIKVRCRTAFKSILRPLQATSGHRVGLTRSNRTVIGLKSPTNANMSEGHIS